MPYRRFNFNHVFFLMYCKLLCEHFVFILAHYQIPSHTPNNSWWACINHSVSPCVISKALGITLLAVISKIFNKIILERIKNSLEMAPRKE